MTVFKNKNILIISNEPWGDVWFSKHHYAYHLANNNKVIFVNPSKKWRWSNLFHNPITLKKNNDNINVLEYSNIIPLTGRLYLLYHLNNIFVSRKIEKFLTEINFDNRVFWTFDPLRFTNPNLFKPKFSIYHCVDYYYTYKEKIISKSVNLILGVSPTIVEKLKKINTNTFLIPHGIQKNNYSKNELTENNPSNIILFIGSINHRLDYESLLMLSEKHPSLTFRLIGPIDKKEFSKQDHTYFSLLQNKDNVQFTGQKAYKDIGQEIYNAKLGLCFSKQDKESHTLNSLKILQYLSYGKPVFSNYFETYETVDNDIISMSKKNDFVINFDKAISNIDSFDKKIKRIEFSNQFQYTSLVEKIENLITDYFKLSKQNILIISNEPWGEIWYSKHNYAYELSKKNKIIFLNPAKKISMKIFFKTTNFKEQDIMHNLVTLDYYNIIPSRNYLLFTLNELIISFQLKKKLQQLSFNNFIYWSFDPYRICRPQSIGPKLSIFHSVDRYLFKHWGEFIIYKNVNHIFCVSKIIANDYKLKNKTTLELPHAISTEEFYSDKNIITPFQKYGLYIGNIDERIDYELLEKFLQSFPMTHFLFVGKIFFKPSNKCANRIFKEKIYSNIQHIGPIKFKELKHYINKSEFCLALMTDKIPGNNISHHKIFQYLAFGKPIFCSYFSEYAEISNLLYMENNSNNLLIRFKSFLEQNENKELKVQRINYAKTKTFEENFNKIESYISNF